MKKINIPQMSIATKSKIACMALAGLTVVAMIGIAIALSTIRIGGPLHREQVQLSDLVADILPPPAYIVEPWLEVSLIANRQGSLPAHVGRLKELRHDYEARKDYWRESDLSPDLLALLMTAQKDADEFWATYDRGFAEAAIAGDQARVNAIMQQMAGSYERHRRTVDLLVAKAQNNASALHKHSDSVLIISFATIAILSLMLLAGIIWGGFFILRKCLKPIAQTADSLGHGLDILASGDLVYRITEELPMEYEHLRSSFNNTASGLTTLLGCVSDSAKNVHIASDEIRAASTDLSGRTELQAVSLKETVSAMDHVTHMVEEGARGTADANLAISEAQAEADAGGVTVRKAMQAMDAIEKSSQEINQIVNVIDGIAFQTNLLALNAGVEAARAGDAGKGFAVVANEVRALAQRSAEAAKDIKGLIKTSSAQVEQGVSLVTEAGTMLTSIVDRIGSINALLNNVAQAADMQAQSVTQINESMQKMDQMTHQNAAMAEQCTAATASLARQSHELTQLVSTFRLKEEQGLHRGITTIPFAAARSEALSNKVSRSAQPASTPASVAAPAKPRALPVQGNAAVAVSNDDWTEF